MGDTCVGKTSILDRYIDDKMAETNVSTIGCDYVRSIRSPIPLIIISFPFFFRNEELFSLGKN